MLAYKLAIDAYELMKNPPPKEVWHRFISKITAESWSPCWLWERGRDKDGYGNFSVNGCPDPIGKRAHRIMMYWMMGPIPRELVVDHIVCNNPPCVNPSHLRLCTARENDKHALTTHCKRGHERTPENQHPAYKKYYGEHVRVCKICTRKRQTEWARKDYQNRKELLQTRSRERQRRRFAIDPTARERNREYQRQRRLAKRLAVEAAG